MKSIVVTGASTGIGWGCAKVLITKSFRVFGSVRKQADAERLSKEFGPNFVPLIFDVTDEAAVNRAAKQVEAALASELLYGLVNNAGIAVPGPLLYLSVDAFRRQINVNLTGHLTVTHRGPGRRGDADLGQGGCGRRFSICQHALRAGACQG